MISEIPLKCTNCLNSNNVRIHTMINTGSEPEMKAKVLDGSAFLWDCPHCGKSNLIDSPTVYIDPQEKLIVICSKEGLSVEIPEDGPYAGFSIRQADSIGALIELVKIFDAGLDDEVLNLCKQVTRMEMKADELNLRFVRLEGADNEIIFTYPKKGQMEMIAIGFNVYEDCKAIIDGHRR